MDESELREMDAKVHKALYPEDEIEVIRDWYRLRNADIEYIRRLNNRVNLRLGLPHYTTDIGAWEPVYALKPEWRWTFELVTDDEGQCAWDVYMAAPVIGAGHYRTYETPYIYEREARGWAAVALGMSRCVIAWAEAQRGG